MSKLLTPFLLLAGSVAVFAGTDVLPNANATVAGNSTVAQDNSPSRYQEVVAASQFSQFTSPITIIALGFRSAVNTGPVSFQAASEQITLSTTQASANTKSGALLSTTFANNVGPDATQVFSGTLFGSAPGCSGPAPCPFNLVIQFTTPFTFDPTKGNLLMDIVASGAVAGSTGSFDAEGFPNTTNSTIVSVAGTPSQSTGTLSPGGYVTEIQTAGATYYFPQLAFGTGWQTTLTYVNYSPVSVSCTTTFYGDPGTPLLVPFGGAPASSRTDALAPGADLHVQTTAATTAANVEGWAMGTCSYPVQASLLYRYYNAQGVAQGEAGVNASVEPATEFVTFAQASSSASTGIAYGNPSAATANVTVTALSSAGLALGSTSFELSPNAHTANNIGPLLGLASFTGSVQIVSTAPIISLSLNAEAFPVFSGLPPGDLSSGTPLAQ
jgi:hypothetical protein